MLYLNGSFFQREESEEGFFHAPQISDGHLEIVVTVETLMQEPELLAMGNATLDWKFEEMAARNGAGIKDGYMKRAHWQLFAKKYARDAVPIFERDGFSSTSAQG